LWELAKSAYGNQSPTSAMTIDVNDRSGHK